MVHFETHFKFICVFAFIVCRAIKLLCICVDQLWWWLFDCSEMFHKMLFVLNERRQSQDGVRANAMRAGYGLRACGRMVKVSRERNEFRFT